MIREIKQTMTLRLCGCRGITWAMTNRFRDTTFSLESAIHTDVDCFEALTEKFQVPDKKAKTNLYSPCSLPSSQQHRDQIVFKR